MRTIATFLLAGFALVPLFCVPSARAADAVAVEPPYVTPGKPITLKWYFTGEKVLLSGGRFGKGVVVTGKSAMTDTPRTTTKYTFDVWYKVPAPKAEEPKGVDPKATALKATDATTAPKAVAPKPGDPKAVDPKAVVPAVSDPKATDPKAAVPAVSDPKAVDPKAAVPAVSDPKAVDPKAAVPAVSDPKATDPKPVDTKIVVTKPADPGTTGAPKVAPTPQQAPAAQETVLKHVQYITYAEVWSGVYPPMKAYRDPHGWQVSFLSDWKRDNVPTAAEGSDGLVYFQQEDDSVERMAVAIMPVKDQTADDVLKKISDDVDGHYQNAKLTDPVAITFNAVPAKMISFTGMDLSHPGTQTASVVLVFVRNGRAYVLSARSAAAHFNSRRPVLEKLLRSFAFNK
jgi:hypothetical protein